MSKLSKLCSAKSLQAKHEADLGFDPRARFLSIGIFEAQKDEINKNLYIRG